MVKLSKKEKKIVDELQAQAEFFDMEVDWETLELVPKKPPKKYGYWDWVNDNRDHIIGDEGNLI